MTTKLLLTFVAGIGPSLGFTPSSLNGVPLRRESSLSTGPLRLRRYLPLLRAREFPSTALFNLYDDWSQDLLSSSQSDYSYDDLILPLDEESIELCLEELMDSDYGKTMFGRHDMAADVGITGSIEFVSLEGPEVFLSLIGKFWHRRETVLGKAAMYLNARIPELTSVTVSSPDDLSDFEDVVDDFTGEVLYVEDKRAPDFNGDRETMEYQGLDPDVRGPFVFSNTGGMIRPA
ncbi:hypothetical protein ACHAXS_012050 [Conticribra weissflogii]